MFLSVRRNNSRWPPSISYIGLTSVPWNIRYSLRKVLFFPPPRLGKTVTTCRSNLSGISLPCGTRLASSAINSVFTVGVHVCYRSRSVHSTTVYAITRSRVRKDVYSCSSAGGEVALNLFQPSFP